VTARVAASTTKHAPIVIIHRSSMEPAVLHFSKCRRAIFWRDPEPFFSVEWLDAVGGSGATSAAAEGPWAASLAAGPPAPVPRINDPESHSEIVPPEAQDQQTGASRFLSSGRRAPALGARATDRA
jgi:hypothetical protein